MLRSPRALRTRAAARGGFRPLAAALAAALLLLLLLLLDLSFRLALALAPLPSHALPALGHPNRRLGRRLGLPLGASLQGKARRESTP